MKLPQKFMDEFLPEARGCRFFGHKLEDLSKEELMVCVALLGKQSQDDMKRHEHEMDMMASMEKAARNGQDAIVDLLRGFHLVR